ncbi:MAG: hypothetical protein A3G82_03625 [Burkholderiales bacterium RIFCSPLOWO2_12_FULL_67_210]|nr:MAG: hypothetical protein A3G82_03625 [Burkholderiales bacterium RIFCSPLOWO2_12_FULL_67_210]
MGQYNPTAYATLHAGIRVLSIDLKTDKGQTRLHKELARTDLLLTSFRPSALRKRPVARVRSRRSRCPTPPPGSPCPATGA